MIAEREIVTRATIAAGIRLTRATSAGVTGRSPRHAACTT
jgi:hypothetical protein